ncbi:MULTISPECIES: hypothetical protein [Kamptonema]|nr:MULTISPECIES: hypothetical protein [Kamptonema]CBN55503.1 hypothetical protein OSCI_2020023 [Kamptonema sp. PCC 6506]
MRIYTTFLGYHTLQFFSPTKVIFLIAEDGSQRSPTLQLGCDRSLHS